MEGYYPLAFPTRSMTFSRDLCRQVLHMPYGIFREKG